MANTAKMCSYELPLETDGRIVLQTAARSKYASLPEPFLIRNVVWFCRFRWMVVTIFVLFGVLSLFPDLLLAKLGMRGYTAWPFITAAVLVLANIAFLSHARALMRSATSYGARVNLWVQIILDLMVLTVVVHFVGSLDTFVPFAYLFHIVLACIFFSRPQSLIVTLIACTMYPACVLAERAGVIPSAGIHADPLHQARIAGTAAMLNVASAMAIWLVVWYLASYLSAIVRQRDRELAGTNQRLKEVQEEKARHMLRTTHELKAPFAAIHANTQLLQKGYCGELTDEALEVIQRIAKRCRRLATEIQEMLQLANLRSETSTPHKWTRIDLADILRWCIGQAQSTADDRSVAIDTQLHGATVVGIEDQLKMLFANVLSNAIVYSHEGGNVRVHCEAGNGNGPTVIFEDNGIGIAEKKVPRIFDEYYRTDEAARHNKESTGLGLTIVHHVASTHKIRVRVESVLGKGTKFTLNFPPTEQFQDTDNSGKEKGNGISADS